jgi:cell division septal protein FtsQ
MSTSTAARILGRATQRRGPSPPKRRSTTRLARPPRAGRRRLIALETIPLVSHLRVNGAWDTQRVICSLILLTVAWIALQCLTAPRFAVGAPVVAGNKGLATSEILDAVRGVQGSNIFLVDSAKVLATVRRLPGVKDAQVRLELPNRVIIEITDQEPRIVWEARGARFLVDGQGEVIKPATDTGRFLLIVDPDPKAEPLAAGRRLDKRAITTVQQLDLQLLNQVKSYEWAANVGITILSNEGWRAIIGWDDDLDAKLQVLRATVATVALRKEVLKSTDVRNPERPNVVSTSIETKPPSAR